MKKSISKKKKTEKICKQRYRRNNLQRTVYCERFKTKILQQYIDRGLWCYITYGNIEIKCDKPT